MAFSGFGAEESAFALPGGIAKPKNVTDADFLIAQLNRFKGASVPAGQQLGNTKIGFGSGITDIVALDALTVVIRRIQGSVEIISDDGSRQLLANARALLTAGDASGSGALVSYVKTNVLEIAATCAGFADSLGLPAPEYPVTVGGLSGVKLVVAAAGAVGLVGYLLWRQK